MSYEPCFNYFQVNITDIWDYELDTYSNNPEEVAPYISAVYDKVIFIISQQCTPVIAYSLTVDENEYYCRRFKKYHNASFHERMHLGYFFYQDSLFSFRQRLVLTLEDHDYHYWFALKLRQYNEDLFYIDKFMDFQLKVYFDKEPEKLYKFLKLILRQYDTNYFEQGVVETVKEYMKSLLVPQKEVVVIDELPKEQIPNTTNQEPLRSQHKKREFQGHYKTLVLEKGLKDNSYYTKHEIHFIRINRLLKEAKFIDRKTHEKHFTAIFTTAQIHPSNRIKWIGTIKELQWFVKYLVYDTKKVIHLRNDIWVATMHCFVNKKGEAYTDAQLRGAKGNNIERKRQLENILTEL